MPPPDDNNKLLGNLLVLSQLGMLLVGSIVCGYFIGMFLDRRFGTQPYLMLSFLVLGIAAGFFQLFKVALKYMKR